MLHDFGYLHAGCLLRTLLCICVRYTYSITRRLGQISDYVCACVYIQPSSYLLGVVLITTIVSPSLPS